ncbi:hypothetical protein SteCoe_34992 [Stentor coeruleus]|uniref:Uncharacterized protein n=1 Tax=Stentor coeruleus TaxID=5963 RepID=A0A1R2ATB4_9CILI|nr:hypothetical protein SteCoe_34992 [Stentor coeruleus]
MGCCIHGKKSIIAQSLEVRPILPSPTIYLEENFKFIDFTHLTKHMKEFKDIRNHLKNYTLSDIRSVKRIGESAENHSSLLVISNQAQEDNIEELCLLVQYSPYGFAVTLVLVSGNLKENSSMEMIHLPGLDSQAKGGIIDIIEWTYEHKDEEFRNPADFPELNMGTRLFKYVLGLFNKSL